MDCQKPGALSRKVTTVYSFILGSFTVLYYKKTVLIYDIPNYTAAVKLTNLIFSAFKIKKISHDPFPWRNLENNALSSLHKLLRNRLVGGGVWYSKLSSRFRNN